MQLNQSGYCITGLMYHDMAIYQYIVASLLVIDGWMACGPYNSLWRIFQDGNAFQVGLSFIDLMISSLCLDDAFVCVCLHRWSRHWNKIQRNASSYQQSMLGLVSISEQQPYTDVEMNQTGYD